MWQHVTNGVVDFATEIKILANELLSPMMHHHDKTCDSCCCAVVLLLFPQQKKYKRNTFPLMSIPPPPPTSTTTTTTTAFQLVWNNMEKWPRSQTCNPKTVALVWVQTPAVTTCCFPSQETNHISYHPLPPPPSPSPPGYGYGLKYELNKLWDLVLTQSRCWSNVPIPLKTDSAHWCLLHILLISLRHAHFDCHHLPGYEK